MSKSGSFHILSRRLPMKTISALFLGLVAGIFITFMFVGDKCASNQRLADPVELGSHGDSFSGDAAKGAQNNGPSYVGTTIDPV